MRVASKSGSVSIKKRRDKLALYIGLPGNPLRFNLPLGFEDTQANRKIVEDIAEDVRAIIRLRNWEKLHELYPLCEQFAAMLPAGKGVTMTQLFAWMKDDWKAKQRRSLDDLLSKHAEVEEFFKPYRVADVLERPQLIEDFLKTLERRGLGPASIQRKFAQVKRAFNFAFKKRKIKELPPFPDDLTEPKARQTRFVGDEVDRLVAKLPERLKRVVRLASRCGWRLEEIVSRKKTDIRWAEGVLYLDAESSKNGTQRFFPLTAEVRACLTEQLEWVRELEVANEMIIPWIFPNDDKRHQVGERIQRFDDALQRACEEAGLNRDPVTKEPTGQRRWFHDLRRTAQDWMEEELGLNDSEIMELVGHKTMSQRKRYRGDSSARRVSGIGEKMERAAAEAAEERARKVVNLSVPQVCHTGEEEVGRAVGDEKKSIISRGLGWAGSESNTRHKDFQS